MRRGSSCLAGIVLATAVGAGTARAGSIIVSGSDAISGAPGIAGLNGAVYQNVSDPAAPISTADEHITLSELLAFESGHGPNATYLSTQAAGGAIAYSGYDSTRTQSFLGSDATGGTYNNELHTTAINLTGYIDVRSAGDYVFSASSDDALFVLIDGQQVLSNGGLHPYTTTSGDAYFNAPGLYSFELIYANQDFNDSGGRGILNFTAPAGTELYASLNASLTDPVAPLPSSALAGLALLGALGLARLRRRAQAT